MAADDLVLDMIKTHSRYDVPEDLTLSCSDVPDQPDFSGGLRGGPRYAGEADRSLKEADLADWPRQKNRDMDAEKRTCVDAWEPDGLGSELNGQDSQDNHFSGQQEPYKHVIGQENSDYKMIGQKHPGSSAVGQEDLGSGMIDDTTTTTTSLKYKSDASLSDVGMSGAGRAGVEVEDDWWDGEGRPTGERWPPLGAPDDQEEDGSSYDSW